MAATGLFVDDRTAAELAKRRHEDVILSSAVVPGITRAVIWAMADGGLVEWERL